MEERHSSHSDSTEKRVETPSTAASASRELSPSWQHTRPPKVAIPRQKSRVGPLLHGRRVRVACQSCRQRKTKCSGETPVCRQCEELNISCGYPASWKERTRGELSNLSAKVKDYENLLKDISAYADGQTADRVLAMLNKYGADGDISSSTSQPQSMTDQVEDTQEGGTSSPSSTGSLKAIERVEEDLNRNSSSRATGYMGKNSEVTWMQSLQKGAEHRSQRLTGTPEAKGDDDKFSTHCMSYHLDNLDISVPGPVEVYTMPPQPVADRLFNDYLNTVHPFFPIINRQLFRSQYQTFSGGSVRPGDKWLAILNLIFAIAAKHAHLTRAPWRGESNDHLVYLTRARILSMNGDVLFSHPDLQQVQVEGLIAFYLLACDQLNRWVLSSQFHKSMLTTCRAWRVAALAVRSSISLGLNLKIASESTVVSTESRYRVWWCLYTFENMLGIMTGRVTYISDGVCKTLFPLPFDEEKLSEPTATKLLKNHDLHCGLIESRLASFEIRRLQINRQGSKEASHTEHMDGSSWLKSRSACSALGFLYYVDLAVIVQEIINRVYSLDCFSLPWGDVENRIRTLKSRIELWRSNLPEAYDFTRLEDQDPDMLRAKLFLGFHFYSSRITLSRPCLCRHESRHIDPAQKSTFSHKMVLIALESAHLMLDLIPNSPDPVWLYQNCPFWCILHYIMQSGTVLLLELSFNCIHVPNEKNNILQYSKKAVLWLLAMSHHSLASRRAWELCDGTLRRLAHSMGYDLSDVYTPEYTDTPQQQQYQPLTTSFPQSPVRSEARGPEPLPSNPDFPFDPISGDLMRSFFPVFQEDNPWDEM